MAYPKHITELSEQKVKLINTNQESITTIIKAIDKLTDQEITMPDYAEIAKLKFQEGLMWLNKSIAEKV